MGILHTQRAEGLLDLVLFFLDFWRIWEDTSVEPKALREVTMHTVVKQQGAETTKFVLYEDVDQCVGRTVLHESHLRIPFLSWPPLHTPISLPRALFSGAASHRYPNRPCMLTPNPGR